MGQCQSTQAAVLDATNKHSPSGASVGSHTGNTVILISQELHKTLVNNPSESSKESLSSYYNDEDDAESMQDDSSWAHFETTPVHCRESLISLGTTHDHDDCHSASTLGWSEEEDTARRSTFVPATRRLSIEPAMAAEYEKALMGICNEAK
ncbi:expressed unknown protein [Seminavis robusta]|uniref:Uncharacterized protein n=1 Tax=Seminavis robusta TaxID=568900 RepID=A0A9N8F0H4_9STRA|nr:expressed unknown protein [Seminavis robusta]|eukprot:Sro2870_g339080.1 n/a (151) ;mRNA; r:4804-5256